MDQEVLGVMKGRMSSKSIASAAMMAAACAESGYGPKQTLGGLTEAALGSLLGSGTGHLAATGADVLFGGETSRSMDELDRMKANEAVDRARSAPVGEAITFAGETQQAHGIACRQPDGTWRILQQ